jgi:SAM-dependent MidA family methyltransferase
MAAEVLAELERLDCLPQHYLILDLSAELRERQRQTIEARVPHLLARVSWLDELPETFTGVMLANEMLDAMPVERFRIGSEGVEAMQVVWAEGRFAGRYVPAGDELAHAVVHLCAEYALAPGYTSELNLHLHSWLQALAEVLERGVVLLIDYGFPGREYYHPQRHEGTLMCHYRHRAHAEPLILPGLQDITAHVDFTAVAEAALAVGLEVRGFANQANFLLGNNLLELAGEAEAGPRRQLAIAAQVKRLMLPGEMGELFQVMALGRGLELPLQGFLLRDERGRL